MNRIAAAVVTAGALAAMSAPADAGRPIPAEPDVSARFAAPRCNDNGRTATTLRIRNHDAENFAPLTLRVRRRWMANVRELRLDPAGAQRLRLRVAHGRPLAATLRDVNGQVLAETKFAAYPC